jgi:hypothetical protein
MFYWYYKWQFNRWFKKVVDQTEVCNKARAAVVIDQVGNREAYDIESEKLRRLYKKANYYHERLAGYDSRYGE